MRIIILRCFDNNDPAFSTYDLRLFSALGLSEVAYGLREIGIASLLEMPIKLIGLYF